MSRVDTLAREHADLDNQIAVLMKSPSADPTKLSALKRRKLNLKDQIAGFHRVPAKPLRKTG